MEWERAKREKDHKIREHFNSLSCHFTSITSEWSRSRASTSAKSPFIRLYSSVFRSLWWRKAALAYSIPYHLRMNCYCHQHIIFCVSTQNPKRLLFLHKFLSHITVSLSLFTFALFHPTSITNMPFTNAVCVCDWRRIRKRISRESKQNTEREKMCPIQFQ